MSKIKKPFKLIIKEKDTPEDIREAEQFLEKLGFTVEKVGAR